MSMLHMTLIGGPTALIEFAGFRLLTDPTFDQPGRYQLPHVTLQKTKGPARTIAQVGRIDAVLLSHDQHADNLDTAGRALVKQVPQSFTTVAGARRLGAARARTIAMAIDDVDTRRRCVVDDHGDAGAPRPGRHRAAVG
jgi:L-ascorbate metabolism protein UlaG (beta-lactamase superfamily)